MSDHIQQMHEFLNSASEDVKERYTVMIKAYKVWKNFKPGEFPGTPEQEEYFRNDLHESIDSWKKVALDTIEKLDSQN